MRGSYKQKITDSTFYFWGSTGCQLVIAGSLPTIPKRVSPEMHIRACS